MRPRRALMRAVAPGGSTSAAIWLKKPTATAYKISGDPFNLPPQITSPPTDIHGRK
jgi:hypothetical protein